MLYPPIQGSHRWTIEAEGYALFYLDFEVSYQQETAFFPVYLIPADGVTRAVLRWGNFPEDLDIVVVPVGVVDQAGVAVDWGQKSTDGVVVSPTSTDGLGQAPYLWWGINSEMREMECVCLPINNPCLPTCNLVSIQGGVQISIDTDSQQHGVKDVSGQYQNDPEATSFRGLTPISHHAFRHPSHARLHPSAPSFLRFFDAALSLPFPCWAVAHSPPAGLLPGSYHIYANAFPPDTGVPTFAPSSSTGEGDVFVDMWLGDGVEVTRVDSVRHPEGSGGKWFKAGYIDVAEAGPGECTGLLQRRQIDTGFCYTWYRWGLRPTNIPASPRALSTQEWPFFCQPFSAGRVAVFSPWACRRRLTWSCGAVIRAAVVCGVWSLEFCVRCRCHLTTR